MLSNYTFDAFEAFKVVKLKDIETYKVVKLKDIGTYKMAETV